MINKKGYTLLETLISMLMISIISLSLASFTASTMKASYINGQQLEKIDFTRFTVDRIISEVKKAEYIYPSNLNISLTVKDPADSTKTITISVNTTHSLVFLIPTDKQKLKYRITAYYLEKVVQPKSIDKPNDPEVILYYNLKEFNGASDYQWDKNSIPAETMLSLTGSTEMIASNIDSDTSSLNYVLSNNNGISDYSLKGEPASTAVTSTKALISGIKWNIFINKNGNEEITVNGLSQNIPRFIEN